MKTAEQLQSLETLAEAIGVRVTYEPMTGMVAGSGGLCKVRGEYRVIMDRRLKAPERLSVLAEALARFDTADQDVPPPVRALLAERGDPELGRQAGPERSEHSPSPTPAEPETTGAARQSA